MFPIQMVAPGTLIFIIFKRTLLHILTHFNSTGIQGALGEEARKPNEAGCHFFYLGIVSHILLFLATASVTKLTLIQQRHTQAFNEKPRDFNGISDVHKSLQDPGLNYPAVMCESLTSVIMGM